MIAWQEIETASGDRGVVHPGHSPVLDTIVLTDATKKYKAGTILRLSTQVVGEDTVKLTTFQAAAPSDTLAAGEACVLVQDSDGQSPECQGLFHGMVVAGRLLDHSGASAVKANATLINKLPPLGIHLTQLFVGETK
jgi:hypothetical protein